MKKPSSNKKIKQSDQNMILKISLSSFFLTLSLVVSFLEIRVPLPNGGEFDLRLFDIIFIFLSTTIVGLPYTIIICIIQPWLHLLIDGDHLVTSILFYSISNVILATIFQLFYIKIFQIDNLKYYDNKLKKIILILLWLIIVTTIGSIVEFSSIIFSGYITLGGFLFDLKETLSIFLILIGVYIVKYILVILLYSIIKKQLNPVLSKFKLNKSTIID